MSLGIIQQKWADDLCRIEDGIFFGNDEVILIDGTPEAGYDFSARTSIERMIADNPDTWCFLYRGVPAVDEYHGVGIDFGETSWEGEGFVAVVVASTGSLIWLLHLSTSEPFVEAVIDGDNIRAVSGGYPMRYEWSIPLMAPERFEVRCHRA